MTVTILTHQLATAERCCSFWLLCARQSRAGVRHLADAWGAHLPPKSSKFVGNSPIYEMAPSHTDVGCGLGAAFNLTRQANNRVEISISHSLPREWKLCALESSQVARRQVW